MLNDRKEYIVTLYCKEDLEEFYEDMETPGGSLYIPDRAVQVENRRPISRNTHYLLTTEEADLLKKDKRVKSVELAELISISLRPMKVQTGAFNKSNVLNSNHLNWGLLRCVEGVQRALWGTNGAPEQTATINIQAEGKNVDVIIIDGHIDPDHPEYALNPDGTGGSRVKHLDWFSLSSIAASLDVDNAPLLNISYVYTPYSGSADLTSDNNHGAHVAGTACGNTQGWASKANIYNISPYSTNPNNLSSLVMWDYIRAFHKTKSINPNTGVKNPTVCNASYGSEFYFPYNYGGGVTTGKITYVSNRGVTTYNPEGLTTEQLIAGGIRVELSGVARVPYYSSALEADIQDAMSEGIIVIAAAGNSYTKIDYPNGPDYNNFMNATYSGFNYSWPIHRGTAPGSVPGVICVGSVGSDVEEYKAGYSNCGPRIDIYAPGTNINSSVNNDISDGGSVDPRNDKYFITKISGTSMAAPQVTGVVACILENYPYLTHDNVKKFLIDTAKKNQMSDTGLGQESVISLQGSPNRYLYLKPYRNDTGLIHPIKEYFVRPESGRMYPRLKIRK